MLARICSDWAARFRPVYQVLLREVLQNTKETMMVGQREQNLPEQQATCVTAERMLRLSKMPLILMYHCVAEAGRGPFVCDAKPLLRRNGLAQHGLGLRGVGVGTLVDAMRAGRHRGLVGITFDDGFDNLVEAALPALLRHGFTATMFIISGLLGQTGGWVAAPIVAFDVR